LENVLKDSIGKAELFNLLGKKEIDYILEHSCIINLNRNERLFSIGEKAERFYLLVKGNIRIYKAREDLSLEELAHYTLGEVIGDFDFARKAQYDADALAAEDSTLIMFPASGFTMTDIVREEPNIATRILLNSIIMVTDRIKATQNLLLENLSWVNELHRRAYEDPGTGLWKQVFLNDEINRILEQPMSLIMLKPDRFKILVDAHGHEAGDKAMVKIAKVLKSFTAKLERGWALRFKSNETGLLINKCPKNTAENLAAELLCAISALEPVAALGEFPAFDFSGTVAWSTWPDDCTVWDDLFNGTYALLLDTWKNGNGGQITHYAK
jgi:diguanylate cyclase (GGDEF)-like protein